MDTTMSDLEAKLKELGHELPAPAAPAGNYVPYVKSGTMLHLSGTLPMIDGQMTHTGKAPSPNSIEDAYAAAQVCALNTLSNIKAALGSLEAVKRIVFVGGFVNGTEGFADSPAVINGASDLFVKLFGDAGMHARAAVAVAGLPKDATVEIQCIVEF